MDDAPEHLRWIAVVTYSFRERADRSRSSFRGVRGAAAPDRARAGWNTIISIVVTLNPDRATYPGDTVEAAERR